MCSVRPLSSALAAARHSASAAAFRSCAIARSRSSGSLSSMAGSSKQPLLMRSGDCLCSGPRVSLGSWTTVPMGAPPRPLQQRRGLSRTRDAPTEQMFRPAHPETLGARCASDLRSFSHCDPERSCASGAARAARDQRACAAPPNNAPPREPRERIPIAREAPERLPSCAPAAAEPLRCFTACALLARRSRAPTARLEAAAAGVTLAPLGPHPQERRASER